MELSDSSGSSSTVTQSMCHVRASELYPKRDLETDESPPTLEPPLVPFVPLAGESVEYLGRGANNTVLALSNYRFYLKVSNEGSKRRRGIQDSNIPLGLIEMVEIKDLFYIIISCKDSRTCRCTFTTNDLCLEWYKRLTRVIVSPKNVQDVFAFAFHAWAIEDQCNEDISSNLGHDGDDDYFMKEIERLNISVLSDNSKWRISKVNWDYKLCATYPNRLLVPSCITDQTLEAAAKFRSSKRVPVIVWRHKGNGAILARCSQPEVGWLGWRSSEDEDLLKAIAESCQNKSKKPKKLVVIDARSYPSAVANRARGGGCECPEYYPGCEIRFMNLANIHAVRKSFHLLRQLCASPPDLPNWYSLLENTRWLHNISGLLHAANTVAATIEFEMQPVLVHCSDGWDRTPQIVSLAELMLDSYYRTIDGFRVLCQREWLDFGHKFADRGQGEDPNERCPVFIQWLDCVHNVMSQYPCAFEFSKTYLVKLAQHTYSNLFGTFLCNSGAERKRTGIGTATFSVWKHLAASAECKNHLYSSQPDNILWISCNVRDMNLWRDLYVGPFTDGPQLTKPTEICNPIMGMDGIIDPIIRIDQPIVINSEDPCIEFSKPEDISLDERDEKSSDTNSSSLSSIITEENGIERHSSPTNCILNTVDGLLPLVDDIQNRLRQLNLEHKTREAALQNELHVTRLVLLRQASHRCNGIEATTTPDVNGLSLADKIDDDVSVCSSTGGETTLSWEPVESFDAQPTLWVPDHAVTQCMSCDNKFWLGRRKHHCRSCGKIFCADCSRNLVPLPAEQLYEPVRVCEPCFSVGALKTTSTSTTTTTITCKQAVADDQKNVNITLQPAPSN
ncbi:myotubularin-related protein 3 isoform X1 [Aphis craccivora]|uniref:Lateral signaling target protein 2 homolog n=1 Tax=Aphis craccivora TaxID=307492 RepID=A0A6G0Z407_APHCR|nr:myotubularin-related protein 3 isoform X1 [Aphis craccivora]